jgi:succinoglycan biosynthesis transport protein ExoP
LVEEQKKLLLSLRSDKDQISVYLRDVESAQRAYDAVSLRLTQINMEGQNNQANTRLLSSAVLPLQPSRPKVMLGLVASVLGGLVVGLAAALAIEALDRRVRRPEDLMVTAGVPVIGVLRPAGSSRPVFRKLLMVNNGPPHRPALAALPGARS